MSDLAPFIELLFLAWLLINTIANVALNGICHQLKRIADALDKKEIRGSK